MTSLVKLILEDGSEYPGKPFGYPKSISGEVVFNTAMTGYPESLTDPSYRGQILISTYPLVGNYGVPEDIIENGLSRFYESDRIQVNGFIISDYSFSYSHWNAKLSLHDWLHQSEIPGIYGLDTRAITKKIREKGVMLGKIIYDDTDVDLYDPNKLNLVSEVSCSEPREYGSGKIKVILVDCGTKNNIIRCLINRDVTVKKVPWNYDYLTEEWDGIIISNGPGNPIYCKETVNILKNAFTKEKPIFGICMGNQLMSMAAGAETYKLKYGHRSHNQPVRQIGTNKCYITSQNHGYAVAPEKLSSDWEPLFINVNDNTNEGIKHKRLPFFSSQFHPEASSGPTDTEFLFDLFIDNIKKAKLEQNYG